MDYPSEQEPGSPYHHLSAKLHFQTLIIQIYATPCTYAHKQKQKEEEKNGSRTSHGLRLGPPNLASLSNLSFSLISANSSLVAL